jgi:hypothetical protein
LTEKRVLVGVLPEVVVLDPGDQAEWISNAGNIKIEFDSQRCPFSSNVFQAPPGVRLNPGSYKYRLSLNDVVLAQGEVLVREK